MSDARDIYDLFGLSDKVALVTGGANGIGREIVRLFSRAGAAVVAADLDFKGASMSCADLPGRARAVCFDQSDPASIVELFADVRANEKRLDVLVNCAGIFEFMPFEQVNTTHIDRTIAINLRGVFQCVQQAVEMMKQQSTGGSIINISSVNAKKACVYDNVHYGLSKAGVDNITISVALEYAGHNIRVNSVLPGAVRTAHADAAAAHYALRGPFTQPGRIPLTNSACNPSQVANACLFFASDASTYVTGQLLAVDGGFLVS